MHAVTAGCRLADQMVIVECFQVVAGLAQIGSVERGGGVGVNVGAGIEAKPAEQALLVRA